MEEMLHNSTSNPENVDDSLLSGDEAAEEEPVTPPPKKSRRGAHKKIVSVAIGGGDGSTRSKGEVYPPPDSWSWRKYGQKPIKGSPYPRAYYRCSSSKGCPARKQVERNRLNPTMLLITYTHEHTHPYPTTNNKYHHRNPPTVTATATTTTTSNTSTTSSNTSTATTEDTPTTCPSKDFSIFINQPNLEANNIGFSDLAGEFGWLSEVGPIAMLESPALLGPKWETSIEVMLPIGEEDQSLFGDLEELPEYSMVFR